MSEPRMKDRQPIPVRFNEDMELALRRVAGRQGLGMAQWIRTTIYPALEEEIRKIEAERARKRAP